MDIIFRSEAIDKGLKRYFTGKPCKYGHISNRMVSTKTCIECKNIRERIYSKIEKNKNIDNKQRRNRYNSDPIYANKIRSRNKKYNEKRKIKIKNRRKSDILFLLKDRYKSRINKHIRSSNIKTNKGIEEIIGCSFEYFRNHIERQFKNGMSWDNRNLWHIDHVVPISNARNETDLIELNHFTNLRPIWAKENLIKRNKNEFLI